MVQRRRHADVHHINVFPGQQRIVVVGDERDSGFPRQRVAAFLGSGANAPDRHEVPRQPGVIRQMHPRPVTRAHHANAQRLHPKFSIRPFSPGSHGAFRPAGRIVPRLTLMTSWFLPESRRGDFFPFAGAGFPEIAEPAFLEGAVRELQRDLAAASRPGLRSHFPQRPRHG